MRALFSPSLMCMDFLNVKEQLCILERHMDMLHFDVMDGHFCKNFALSPDFLSAIKQFCSLPVDVHLMVENPEAYISVFCDAGADFISLHAETINACAFRIIQTIRSYGAKVGVVLNPASPLESIREYLDEVDLLTIMTVDPGFAGQPFNERMLAKIRHAGRLRDEQGYRYLIQADGAVSAKTFGMLKKAGNECYIIGKSGLFSICDSLEESCIRMKVDFEKA